MTGIVWFGLTGENWSRQQRILKLFANVVACRFVVFILSGPIIGRACLKGCDAAVAIVHCIVRCLSQVRSEV